MFKGIEHFSGRDPDPGRSLEEIRPLSRRAYSLMIRSRTKPLLQERFLNIVGAIEMVAGLEYHHDNIVRTSAQLAAGAPVDDLNVFHEAVAYVNRMGQFYYFTKSKFVARAVPAATSWIPAIEKYIVFRMKHAAHRSIDSPRDEPEHVQLSHAMSLTRAWGMGMKLKPGAPEIIWSGQMKADSPEARAFDRLQWQTRHITFQIYDADHDKHVHLTIEREHEQICSEAYALLSAVILWEP